jgi:hypothetical protein
MSLYRMPRCLSPHVPRPVDQCEQLDWEAPRPRERVRVIAWTCDCTPPVYELCTAGGQWLIRRTADVVEVSPRWSLWHETQAMWSALLLGQIR